MASITCAKLSEVQAVDQKADSINEKTVAISKIITPEEHDSTEEVFDYDSYTTQGTYVISLDQSYHTSNGPQTLYKRFDTNTMFGVLHVWSWTEKETTFVEQVFLSYANEKNKEIPVHIYERTKNASGWGRWSLVSGHELYSEVINKDHTSDGNLKLSTDNFYFKYVFSHIRIAVFSEIVIVHISGVAVNKNAVNKEAVMATGLPNSQNYSIGGVAYGGAGGVRALRISNDGNLVLQWPETADENFTGELVYAREQNIRGINS